MCGIAGIVHLDLHEKADPRMIESMNRALVHRGPDDGGTYVEGHVGLGNRRLSIIDRSAGHQPMSNEDGTIWITFNGEIYNYAELREGLIAKGHRFTTSSDTEVVVHLYEDLGPECFRWLQGMFALAIWDKGKGILLLARDRLGIKPLYYVQTPGFLAFSSEIKPLLTIPSIDRRLDLQALHDYFTFKYTIAPETMIEGIRKLPPGHLLLAQGKDVKLQQYWDLDFPDPNPLRPEEDYVEEFYQRFKATVSSHLIGEVPLGVLLSGGIDSTAVTAVVSELVSRRVKTFSIAFADEGDRYDERRYAWLAARAYDTEHHEIVITGKEFADGLSDYVWSMEEPVADPASVPLYYVAKLASDHVTIILSGEGSDELLGGYMAPADFKGFSRARWFRRLPGFARNHLLKPVNDRFIGSARLTQQLAIANAPLSHYLQAMPMYMGGGFSDDARWKLYGARMPGAASLTRSQERVVECYRRAARFDFVNQILYVQTKQWLPDDLLVKADKMTMAHSLELRVPFLDHRFVEFVAGLPTPMKVRRDWRRRVITKCVLRRAFKGKMPPEILHRRKLGFPVPLPSMLQGVLKPVLRDELDSRAVRESGLFDRQRILTMLRANERTGEHSAELWMLLVFCMWLRLFKVAA